MFWVLIYEAHGIVQSATVRIRPNRWCCSGDFVFWCMLWMNVSVISKISIALLPCCLGCGLLSVPPVAQGFVCILKQHSFQLGSFSTFWYNLQNSLFFFLTFILYVWIFYLNIFMCIINAWCLRRSEKSVRSSGTGAPDVFEPPCGCWELNPGP